MITVLFGSVGYEVRHALNISDGLNLVKKEHFDLILLDWIFNDGSGVELCRMIRSFNTQTPILFYSGVAYNSEIKQAMSAGAQGFLVKPVEIEELIYTVSRFVNNDSGENSQPA